MLVNTWFAASDVRAGVLQAQAYRREQSPGEAYGMSDEYGPDGRITGKYYNKVLLHPPTAFSRPVPRTSGCRARIRDRPDFPL